jgi:putative sporulation protein YyaC
MSNTVYFNAKEQYVQWKLNSAMLELIRGVDKRYSNIVVVCIGTDRSTGDSFGPLTGHMLSQLSLIDFSLYGTLDKPVHALSLPEVMGEIDTDGSLVVAVDAGVGDPGMVGSIGLGYEPVRPGSGLGKTLPSIGDISVTGIVAMGGLAPFIMLQNAPLGMVYCMAEKAFFAIQYALRMIQLESRVGLNGRGAKKTAAVKNGPLSAYTDRFG